MFCLLRIYHLPQTQVFFGDSARDLLELHEWQNTLLPPLLGPHTSVLSFNQSAWYFYWLMPFFVLTQGSLFTANVAVLAYFALWFVLSIRYRSQVSLSLFSLATGWALLTFHPEVVTQMRTVWNPTFILLPLLALYLLLNDWLTPLTPRRLMSIAFLLSLSVGLSYSVAPYALVVTVLSIVRILRQSEKFKLLGAFVISLLVSNLAIHIGTLAFELRSEFLLTKNLGNQQILQVSTNQYQKWLELNQHLHVSPLLWLALVAAVLVSFVIYRRGQARLLQRLLVSVSLLLLTTGMTLAAPFSIHSHYIFAILAGIIVSVISMPRKVQLAVVTVFASVWIWQLSHSGLFTPASPTMAQKLECLQQVCSVAPVPIYVVGNTPSHDHQALEYSYLAKTSNCDAFSVTEAAGKQPKTMALFNQDAEYTPGKTDFYELNVFADAKLGQTIICSNSLSVTLFQYERTRINPM